MCSEPGQIRADSPGPASAFPPPRPAHSTVVSIPLPHSPHCPGSYASTSLDLPYFDSLKLYPHLTLLIIVLIFLEYPKLSYFLFH